MRSFKLGFYSLAGGFCLSYGASHDNGRLVLLSLLLLGMAVFMIVTGRRVSRKVREHANAAWHALVLAHLLRLFR